MVSNIRTMLSVIITENKLQILNYYKKGSVDELIWNLDAAWVDE